VLGLPPHYGLIPQAPLHVRSLAKIREAAAPGGAAAAEGGDGGGGGGGGGGTEVWVSVVETRVSALGQSLLILALLSDPLLAALGCVPSAVLAGLFLYLGAAGLRGNGLAQRVAYMGMDAAGRRGVRAPWAAGGSGGEGAGQAPTWAVVAGFTLLQCACVGAIFGVTLTPGGIAFPVLIVLLVPLRLWGLPRLFGADALAALDPLEPAAAGKVTAGVPQDAAEAVEERASCVGGGEEKGTAEVAGL
jgi:hypothetical protein